MPDRSKFGGIPVEEQSATVSRFGGVPVSEDRSDHAVRDALKNEGFLESAWNAIKSPFSFMHAIGSGEYAAQGQEQRQRAAELAKSGTPEQKREFAKEVLLQNIPLASTFYKAFQGNLEGAVGDVAGAAALVGAAKVAPKVASTVSEVPGKVRAVAQDPGVRAQAAKLPGVSTVKKVVDFGKAASRAVDIYKGKPIHPEIPVTAQPVGDRYANPPQPADPYAPKTLINRDTPAVAPRIPPNPPIVTPPVPPQVPTLAPQPAQVQPIRPSGTLPMPNVQGAGGPRRIPMPVDTAPQPSIPGTPPAKLTPAQIAEQLRAEMVKSGSIPEGPIPMDAPEFSQATFEASARAAKVGKLAKALKENGITYEDARNMGLKEWKMLSEATGEKMPSATSIEHALFELKKLEKPTPVPKPKANRRTKKP